MEDSTGEWIDFNNEAAIVCKQFVLTRTSKSAMLWPAMTFHVFPKAKEVLKKYPAYNSTGEYVEFLHGDGRYEYSFVQPFLLEKFEEEIAMKKPNKRLQAAFDEATKAKNAVDEVIEVCTMPILATNYRRYNVLLSYLFYRQYRKPLERVYWLCARRIN